MTGKSQTTDLLPELREALSAGDGGISGERLNAWAISEIERLRAVAVGFMRCIQTDNSCNVTGQPCDDTCGCRDEMMEWCK